MPDLLQYTMIHRRRRPDDDDDDDDDGGDNDDDGGSITSWRTDHSFQDLHRLLSDLAVNVSPHTDNTLMEDAISCFAMASYCIDDQRNYGVLHWYGNSRSDPTRYRFPFKET
jgi:hypothetical protein